MEADIFNTVANMEIQSDSWCLSRDLSEIMPVSGERI